MRNLSLIIQREYLARVRNKTFIIMTFLSPLIFVGMIMLIAYLSMLNSTEQKIIGIHDETGLFFLRNLRMGNRFSTWIIPKNLSSRPVRKYWTASISGLSISGKWKPGMPGRRKLNSSEKKRLALERWKILKNDIRQAYARTANPERN